MWCCWFWFWIDWFSYYWLYWWFVWMVLGVFGCRMIVLRLVAIVRTLLVWLCLRCWSWVVFVYCWLDCLMLVAFCLFGSGWPAGLSFVWLFVWYWFTCLGCCLNGSVLDGLIRVCCLLFSLFVYVCLRGCLCLIMLFVVLLLCLVFHCLTFCDLDVL